MRQKSHFGGFTLVELLISLSILMSLSFLLLPSLTGVNARYVVSLKAWEIKRNLEYTRSMAITRNAILTLCTARDNFQCVREGGSKLLIFDDADHNYRWTPDESLYRDTRFANVRVNFSASGRSPGLRFKNTGHATGSGNFHICMTHGDDFGRQVIFYYSGRVRLSADSDKDGYDDRSRLPILCE
jgi:type IV fimbrial biogenesis protein FimT